MRTVPDPHHIHSQSHAPDDAHENEPRRRPQPSIGQPAQASVEERPGDDVREDAPRLTFDRTHRRIGGRRRPRVQPYQRPGEAGDCAALPPGARTSRIPAQRRSCRSRDAQTRHCAYLPGESRDGHDHQRGGEVFGRQPRTGASTANAAPAPPPRRHSHPPPPPSPQVGRRSASPGAAAGPRPAPRSRAPTRAPRRRPRRGPRAGSRPSRGGRPRRRPRSRPGAGRLPDRRSGPPRAPSGGVPCDLSIPSVTIRLRNPQL